MCEYGKYDQFLVKMYWITKNIDYDKHSAIVSLTTFFIDLPHYDEF